MKYLKKRSLIILAFAAILSGCTQSNIVSPSSGLVEGDGQPDLEVTKDIPIDWVEVTNDVREVYMEPYGPFASYVMDMAISYDSDSKTVKVLLPVTHKTTPEIAARYGEAILKLYYGSYFDENNVLVQVFFYDEEGNEDSYLVNDTMKAGEQRALVPRA